MQILRSRENPLLKRGLSLAQRLNYFASMTTYFQALQLAVFVSMPLFFVWFVPYMAITLATIKATGSSQRLVWDQYFSFLRMFTFLRALPTLLSGGRNIRFRATPKAPAKEVPRAALYPHLGAAMVNLGVIAPLICASGPAGARRLDDGDRLHLRGAHRGPSTSRRSRACGAACTGDTATGCRCGSSRASKPTGSGPCSREARTSASAASRSRSRPGWHGGRS